jgi:hypothetical protein
MKKLFVYLFSVATTLFFNDAYSQNPSRVSFNGTFYYDNDVVYIPCNQTVLNFSASSWNGQNYGNTYISLSDVDEPHPAGWSGPPATLKGLPQLTLSANSNGGILKLWVIVIGGPDVITLNVKRSSSLSFTSTPALYANQSATYQVGVNNLFSSLSSMTWETTGGLRVNGNMSATISHNGSGSQSATISTNQFGGNLRVRSNNTCGQSGDWISMVVGLPYISSKTVNGSAAQSTNYTGSSPTLNVYTDNTANNCTWSIVSGSGFLSSNGFTCGASIWVISTSQSTNDQRLWQRRELHVLSYQKQLSNGVAQSYQSWHGHPCRV